MFKILTLIAAATILNSCASIQGQSQSPEEVERELSLFAQNGDVPSIENYFAKYASNFPSGIGYQKTEKPSLYVGSKEKLYTFDSFMRDYRQQNESFEKLKTSCSKKEEGISRIKCLTSYGSPCDGRSSNTCALEESQNSDNLGLFSIKNADQLSNAGTFTTNDNVKWFVTELNQNLDKANQQRKDQMSSHKSEVADNKLENRNGPLGKIEDGNEKCEFFHNLVDDNAKTVRLWARKELNLSDDEITGAMTAFGPYTKYETTRQRSNVVMKEIKKPKIVIVEIFGGGNKDKTLEVMKKVNPKLASKFKNFYYSGHTGASPILFTGYKKVPCGLLAVSFDRIISTDIGIVIEGAKFFPRKNSKK